MSMTGSISKSDVLSGPERRRRWAPAEKLAIVAETAEPGMSVSLVVWRHGIAPNQLFAWRRLASQGALTATQAQEEVVPASEDRMTAFIVRCRSRSFDGNFVVHFAEYSTRGSERTS